MLTVEDSAEGALVAEGSHPVGQENLPDIDASKPHTARFWNYLLGGTDNYRVDRAAAEQILAVAPGFRDAARAVRGFLARAVRHLVAEVEIRQFLDIGTGLPTANNTHEVAQAIAPECRVVYVDNDPMIMAYARALLTSTPEGATDYVFADLRDPDTILREAAGTLDLTQPVGLMLLGVLNHIMDTAEAHAIVNQLVDALPPGSYLAVSHPTTEIDAEVMLEVVRRWNEGGGTPPVVFRDRHELTLFFDRLELLEPGIVSCSRWRPDPGDLSVPTEVYEFCGVGRKP